MRRGIFGIFCLCLVTLFFPGFVSAVQLSPPAIEYVASPGEVISGELLIIGEVSKSEKIILSLEEFRKVGEENDREFYLPEEGTNTLGHWITLDADLAQEILPAQITKIPYHISVPIDAPPGGHYAVIVVTGEKQVDQITTTGAGLTPRVVGQILLTVRGEIVEELVIESFDTADHGWFYPYLPINFITRVKNVGTVHSTPVGYVEPFVFDTAVKSISINSSKLVVFPKTIRKFESTWEEGPGPVLTGNMLQNFWSQVVYEWQNFRLGWYKVRSGLVYGEKKNHSLQAAVDVIVFPYHLVIFILIMLISIMVVRRLRKKRSKTDASTHVVSA